MPVSMNLMGMQAESMLVAAMNKGKNFDRAATAFFKTANEAGLQGNATVALHSAVRDLTGTNGVIKTRLKSGKILTALDEALNSQFLIAFDEVKNNEQFLKAFKKALKNNVPVLEAFNDVLEKKAPVLTTFNGKAKTSIELMKQLNVFVESLKGKSLVESLKGKSLVELLKGKYPGESLMGKYPNTYKVRAALARDGAVRADCVHKSTFAEKFVAGIKNLVRKDLL